MKDQVKQFKTLMAALSAERQRLVDRLAAIEAALDGTLPAKPAPAKARAPRKPREPRKERKPRTPRGPMSFKEAVCKVTEDKALTKEEILAEVAKLGVVTKSKDPLVVVGTVVYGKKPKFTNTDGKFQLVK